MRKQVIAREPRGESHVEGSFLDLERLARVEITSEDPGHPIEAALVPGRGDGWRAAEPGPQTIRVLFDEPQRTTHFVSGHRMSTYYNGPFASFGLNGRF